MAGLFFALLVPEPSRGRSSVKRDRVADGLAVLGAGGYGAVAVSFGDATSAQAAIPLPVDVVLGVACCLALLTRRRWPTALAVAIIPFSAVSVMATGAAAMALFTVVVRRRVRVALVLGLAYVATGPIYHALQVDSEFPFWVDVVARLITGGAAIGWGMFVQAYRRLTESLRDHAARLESEQELRVNQARLTERARIAREMHDVLAHRMSLVSLHAGALEVRPDARPEEVAIAAGAIRSGVHDALEELRTAIGVLREDAGGRPEPPQPGLGDVPELIESARATGMTVRYTCAVPGADPSIVLGRTAFRIIQEGLTNARKHAPGSAVDILLDGAPGAELRVQVTNQVPSTPENHLPGSGMGLVGVGERVAMVGGRVAYGPGADGFRLEASLPWPR